MNKKINYALCAGAALVLFAACTNPMFPPSRFSSEPGIPLITTQPQSAVYAVGDPAEDLTVEAYADNGALSYQWYRSGVYSNEGGTLIENEDEAYYTPPVNTQGTVYYYVTVTNTHNGKTAEATSEAAAITVYGNGMGSTTIGSAAVSVTAPTKDGIPDTTATAGAEGFSCGEVTWSPDDNPFAGGAVYTATVTLTADEDYTFAEQFMAAVNNQNAAVGANTGTSVTLSITFPATNTLTVTDMSIIQEPTKTAYVNRDALDLGGLAVTLSYENGTTENVAFNGFAAKNISTTPPHGTILNPADHNSLPVTVTFGSIKAYTIALSVGEGGGPSVIRSAVVALTAPTKDGSPGTTATAGGEGYSCGEVTWSPSDSPFGGGAVYTATVTLTANTGYTFANQIIASINNQNATVSANNGSSVTLSLVFPATNTLTVTGMVISQQPTKTTYNHRQALDLSGLTVTLTYENNTTENVAFSGFAGKNISTYPPHGAVLTADYDGLNVVVTFGNIRVYTNSLTVNGEATGPTIIHSAVVAVTAPTKDGAPGTTATAGGAGYSCGAVTWTPSQSPFAGGTVYTAAVTLTANTGYAFAGQIIASINNQNAAVSANNGSSVTLSLVFPATNTLSVTNMSITQQPNKTVYNHREALDLNGLAVTLTYENNTTENVAFNGFAGKNISTYPPHGAMLTADYDGLNVVVTFGNIRVYTNSLTVNGEVTGPTIIHSAVVAVTAPTKDGVPGTTATAGGAGYSCGPVTWTPNQSPFAGNTVYTASVTLTANAGYAFAGQIIAAINNQNATVSAQSGSSVTLSLVFPATNTLSVTNMSITQQPTKTVYNHREALDLNGLAVTLVYENNTTENVAFNGFAGKNISTYPPHGAMLTADYDGLNVVVTFGNIRVYTDSLAVSGGVTPGGPTIIHSAVVAVTAPTKDGSPDTTATAGGAGYSCGAVSWSPSQSPFAGNTVYTASVTLTANTGYAFAGQIIAAINNQNANVTANTGSTITLSLTFPATNTLTVTNMSITQQPAKMTYNYRDALDLSGLAVTLVYENGSTESVAFNGFAGKNISTYPPHGAILTADYDGLNIMVTFGNIRGYTEKLTLEGAVTGPSAIHNAVVAVTAPTKDSVPDTTATAGGNGYSCGPVTWSPSHSPFGGGTVYTATVTLTADSGFMFATQFMASVNNQNAMVSGNTGSTVTLSLVFPVTNTLTVVDLTINQQPGRLNYNHRDTLDLGGLAVTLIYEGGSTESVPFSGFARKNISMYPPHGAILSYTEHDGLPVMITFGNITVYTDSLTVNGEAGEPSIIRSAAVAVTAPTKDSVPSPAVIVGGAGYSGGTVTWTPNDNPFKGGTAYTANVTLTADAGYVFASQIIGAINNQNAAVSGNTGTTVTLSLEFPSTSTLSITDMKITQQPTRTVYNYGETLNLNGLAVTLTYEDGTEESVEFNGFATKNISTRPAHGTTLTTAGHNGLPVEVILGNFNEYTGNLTVGALIMSAAVNITPPSNGAVPGRTAESASDLFDMGEVTWRPDHPAFQGGTVYTATVTLTAKENSVFAMQILASINDQNATVIENNTGATVRLSLTFAPTSTVILQSIEVTQQAAKMAYVHGEALDLSGLTVKLSYGDHTEEIVEFANFGTKNIAAYPVNGTIMSLSAHNGQSVMVMSGGINTYTSALTVSKAPGAAVGVPTVRSITANSITVNPVSLLTNTGQAIEYAIAMTGTASPDSLGWQPGTAFYSLNVNYTYYVYARSSGANSMSHNAGAASVSAPITLQTFTINVADIFDGAGQDGLVLSFVVGGSPTYDVVLYRTGGAQTATITITNDAGYTIEWWYGEYLLGNEATLTLNAYDYRYGWVGKKYITVIAEKAGSAPSSKRIPIEVRQSQ